MSRFMFAGKIVRYSCVYGVEDLPIIAKQHHFVAHKLYIDFEPAAYFCLLKVSLQFTALLDKDYVPQRLIS